MAQKYNIKKRFVFSLIAISLSVSTLFSSAFATVYTWTQQTGSGSHYWVDIASSSDGTKLAAAAEDGYIYTSTDAGVTWTEQTAAGSRRWYGITSSADGTKLAAINYTGYIYTSTDSGVTWTEQTSSGLNLWTSIASSADGTKLVAGATYEYIYTSNDSGVTWTQQTGAGARGWFGIASSADGAKIAAASYDGNIYTSTDSGVTWTERSAAGQRGWFGITSSADGTKLAAVGYFGIYVSTDSGATWTWGSQNIPANLFTGITSSSDGVKLAAVASVYDGGYIYASTDSGLTWTQTGPLVGSWRSVTSSSDGTKLAAIASNTNVNNYIYTGIQNVDTTAPTLTSFTSTTPDGSYGIGSSVNVTARFNENLGTGSTMTVVLNTGATVVLNTVSSMSLSGTYTVASPEATPDLTVSSITSASVNDVDLNNATSFTVPAAPNNIRNVKNIVIETTLPTLRSFTSTTPNGFYGPGASIDIVAIFSENLAATSTASSTMTVVLDTGATVTLNTVSGTRLSGTYTVAPGETSPDLTVASITSASVYDRALNNVTSFTVPLAPNNIANVKAIVIDSVPPTLTSFTSTTPNGSYGPGANINIRATFNENLGAGSTMTVVLDTGATVTLNTVSGTRLSGTYTVAPGETSPDLTVASITSASVYDRALNNVTSFTVPLAPNNIANVKAIVIDSVPPTLTSFTSTTPNGSYGPGANINIRATFNENLGAGSTMTVVLDTGATVTLNTVSGTRLSGTYTVAPGETSPDLTVASITSASVYDRALNNVTSFTVPAAPNNIANVKAIVIDSVPPTLTSFTSTTPNGSYGPGANINIRATFNENLGAGSTMTVVLDTGATVTLNTVSGTRLSGTYTVAPGETSPDLTVASITSASVYDRALNNVTSFTVPAAPNNIANVKAIKVN